jgi:hypothetical protein
MTAAIPAKRTLMVFAGLLGIAILHFLTMPKYIYSGDNIAIKVEAAHLINTGRIGIDYKEAEIISGRLLEYRGQYFYDNDLKQKHYSKYGLFYTLCYLPPLMFKKIVTGELPYLDASDQIMLIGNCYYILITLIYIAYLFKVFSLFNKNSWQLAALVLVAIYASYNWYYLRSPDKEIFQMVSFTAAAYHTLRFLRPDHQEIPSGKQLGLALAWAGFTYLLKPLYALLVIVIAAFATWRLYRSYRSAKETCLAPGSPWRYSVIILTTMPLLIMAISFTHNYLRCNNIFIAGYGQDTHDPVEFSFTAAHFLGGLATYFIKPGNGNWFLHQPLLLLALGGYANFYRTYRTEALFLLTVVAVHLLVLCFHTEWIGEWCYGPRFCLHLVMCAAIPAALGIQKLLARSPTRNGNTIRGGALLTLSVLVLLSLRAQIYVNSWEYFIFYRYSDPFYETKQESLSEYFSEMPHRALLNRDLALYRDQGRKFPLLNKLDNTDLPIETKEALYAFTEETIGMAEWNYLMLPKPQG